MPSSLQAIHASELQKKPIDPYESETFRRVLASSRRMVRRVNKGLWDDFKLVEFMPENVEGLQVVDIDGADILRAISDESGVRLDALLGERRGNEVAHPRMLACYIMCEHTGMSLPEIGRVVRKDHTTVMNARRRVPELLSGSKGLTALYQRVRDRLAI